MLDPRKLAKTPLFKMAAKQLQAHAQHEFRSTVYGRMLREAARYSRDVKHGPEKIGRMLEKYGKTFSAKSALRELIGTPFGQMYSDCQKYTRMGGITKTLLNQFLGEMGPFGKMLQTMLGKSTTGKTGLSPDIDAAVRLIQAFGGEVMLPTQRRGDKATSRSVGAARQFLESLGYTVIPPGEEPEAGGKGFLPFGLEERTKAGTLKKTVQFDWGGSKRRLPPNHPALTGAMVLTPKSTNVYQIGYDIESQYLYVRFREGQGNRDTKAAGPGSLYRYSPIDLDQFLRLYKTRSAGDRSGGDSSPGTWIWEHLRIRGTVSGHQGGVNYELVGIVHDYVPRQAVMRTTGEWYLPRRVHPGGGNYATSQKPAFNVRPMQMMPVHGRRPPGRGGGGEPNRGLPRRPNDGSPNNGRQ